MLQLGIPRPAGEGAGFHGRALDAVDGSHTRLDSLATGNFGLIERHTEAQWRRCELRGEGFRAAADWIEFYRRFWETQFDKLDAFLKRTAPKPRKERRRGRVS